MAEESGPTLPRPTTPIVDLDGVLVDFHKASLVAHGIVESVEVFFADKVNNWNYWSALAPTYDAFWAPITEQWWFDLEWTQDGSEILSIVEEMFGTENIYLWSTPSWYPGCKEGKWRWVKKHLPQYEQRLVLGQAKFLAANPLHVLIDDGDHNINAFQEKGGRGCLVPRLWNSEHANSKSTLDVVKTKLLLL